MTEALERLLETTTDVGCSAMYYSGGPIGPASSMGPMRLGGASSFGGGGGYGPVSRMDMDPILRHLLRSNYTLIEPCVSPEPTLPEPFRQAREQMSIYDLGATQVHVHENGIGSIKRKGTNESLYDLNAYQTAMAEYDLSNEVSKLSCYCNKRNGL